MLANTRMHMHTHTCTFSYTLMHVHTYILEKKHTLMHTDFPRRELGPLALHGPQFWGDKEENKIPKERRGHLKEGLMGPLANFIHSSFP